MAAAEVRESRRVVLAQTLESDAGEFAVQRTAIIGASGSGKTYGVGRAIEQLYAAHVPVLIFDTVGVYPSLRVAANGKDPGLKISVVGGDHGDVPIDWTAGEKLARYLFQRRASAVLDLSDGTWKQRAPFVADFCETLLTLLKRRPQPLTVVFDEMPDLCPQKAQKGEDRMVAAVSALVRKGRNHSCGTIQAGQRPQDIAKVAFDQVGSVFVGALFGKHERDAMSDWVGRRARGGVVQEHLGQVSEQPPGFFFLWSPGWLKEYRQIHFLQKWTYDGSATHPLVPTAELRQIAPVDVGELAALMEGTAEGSGLVASGSEKENLQPRATAVSASDSPAELRKEISRLDTALTAEQQRYQQLERKHSELDAMHAELVRAMDAYVREVRHWAENVPMQPHEAREREAQHLRSIGTAEHHSLDERRLERLREPSPPRVLPKKSLESRASPPPARARSPQPKDSSPSEPPLGPRALAVVALYGPLSRAEIALYARSSIKSGALMRSLRQYELEGTIVSVDHGLQLAEGAKQVLPDVAWRKGTALRKAWESVLNDEQRLAWNTLLTAPVEGYTFPELCERAAKSIKSGSFARAVRRLRADQLASLGDQASGRRIFIPLPTRIAFGIR